MLVNFLIYSLLIDYLTKENILKNEEKLETIKNIIYKQSNEKKFNGFLLPGIYLTLIIPIWLDFLNWIYEHTSSFTDIILISIFFFLFVSEIFFIIYGFKFIISDLLNRESNKLADLAYLLEKIQINVKLDSLYK
jgi:hypothetical protein